MTCCVCWAANDNKRSSQAIALYIQMGISLTYDRAIKNVMEGKM